MAMSACLTAVLLAVGRGHSLGAASGGASDSLSIVQAAVGILDRDVPLSTTPLGARSRRIQYMDIRCGGLYDCMKVFRFLDGLADFYNATAHIRSPSPRDFMDGRHSSTVANDWSVYFDTNANHGNPFHLVDQNLECKEIADPDTDWFSIFDDGVQCVNIAKWFYSFNATRTRSNASPFWTANRVPPFSATVQRLAQAALVSARVVGDFGVLHVRRCDRMSLMVENCTKPARVRALVTREAAIHTWLVFTYAEPQYLPALKQELWQESPVPRTRFIFEEDIIPRILPQELDNYLVFATIMQLKAAASKQLEATYDDCPGSQFSMTLAEGSTTAENGDTDTQELVGVCTGLARGDYKT